MLLLLGDTVNPMSTPRARHWTRETLVCLLIAAILGITAYTLYNTIPAARWWATPILVAATIGMMLNAARASRAPAVKTPD